MSDFLSNLRDNYGMLPDTSNIKGIGAYTDLWLSNEERTNTRDLKQACNSMIQILAEVILETKTNLAETGHTHDDLADPMERTLEAYDRLKEVLEDLSDAVSNEDRDEARTLVEEMREANDFLREAADDLEQWQKQETLRCPKCGSVEFDPCKSCRVQLVYIDTDADLERDVSLSRADLPNEYGDLYKGVMAVLDGQLSLSKLAGPLQRVDRSFNSLSANMNVVVRQNPNATSAHRCQECLEQLSSGLILVKSSLQSRRIVELRKGWDLVFEKAALFEELRLELLAEAGGEAGQILAQKLTSQTDQELG
jgi:chemotaxis protein histidine kinase CheA